ncbi:unnamed protein product [Prunus armeniaca]|uniref:Peptidase C13 family protein n=1 Tax=Prunus armeniaca TaxID=36596 RepID=A0A6J5WU80_PRUAR|nr:unnamed protein product [Prunus armeniaca]
MSSYTIKKFEYGISLCLPESVKEIDFSADGENGSPSTAKDKGKRWAILMAGSNGYYNYRHQVSSSTSQRAMTGGSGKVLKSGPNDHVFIYYADDGSAGLLGMPCEDDSVSAKDLIHVLKKKHLCKGFKSMYFLRLLCIEACESGSIFEGLHPNKINIYATTAPNAEESSCGNQILAKP